MGKMWNKFTDNWKLRKLKLQNFHTKISMISRDYLVELKISKTFPWSLATLKSQRSKILP